MHAAATPAQPPQAGAGQTVQESEAPQVLHLLVGRSLVITSPNRIRRVSLADPTIAEAIVVSPTQVVVNGKAPGGVSLIMWDEAGQSQSFEVSVDIDVLGLSQKIHEVFPAEPVQIETSGSVVMLSGKISSAEVADKILEVVKNSTPKVTSLMQVPTPVVTQISLQVQFAEVNRVAMQQLGVNILHELRQQHAVFDQHAAVCSAGNRHHSIGNLEWEHDHYDDRYQQFFTQRPTQCRDFPTRY